RRVRRRLDPAAVVAPPPTARGRDLPAVLRAVPLRVAGRARPDGPDRRAAAEPAVGGLGPVAVQRRQRAARVGVGEAGLSVSRAAVGTSSVAGASQTVVAPRPWLPWPPRRRDAEPSGARARRRPRRRRPAAW